MKTDDQNVERNDDSYKFETKSNIVIAFFGGAQTCK